MNWSQVLQPEVLVFLVPISAIFVGGILGVTKLLIKHRERIALIERGIDPDAPHGESGSGQDPASFAASN